MSLTQVVPVFPGANPIAQAQRQVINAYLLERGTEILGFRHVTTSLYLRFRAAPSVQWIQVHVQSTAAGEGGVAAYDSANSTSSTLVDCREARTQDVTISALDPAENYVVFLVPVQYDGAGTKVLYDGEGGRPDNMSFVGEALNPILSGGDFVIQAGHTLRWSSDNAAGSFIGTSATAGRPRAVYIGTELVVGTDPANVLSAGLATAKVRLQGGMFVEAPVGLGVGVIAYGSTPNYFGIRFNGTKGAETTIVSGNILANLVGVGWDTALLGTGASVVMVATETWTATSHGCGARLVTVSNTTTTATTRWTWDHDGHYYPGNFSTAADNAYDVGRTASRPRTVFGYTADFTTSLMIAGTKVVGAQGAAVADATGGAVIDAEGRTALNALLARLRAHGMIAT